MNVECDNCHQEIAEGDAFCRHCGTKAPAPPGPCPSCGRVNEDDARFCVQCGTSLLADAAPPAAATAPAPGVAAPAAPAEAVAAPAAVPAAAVGEIDPAVVAAPPEAGSPAAAVAAAPQPVTPPAATPPAPAPAPPPQAATPWPGAATEETPPGAPGAIPGAPTATTPGVAAVPGTTARNIKVLTLVGALGAAVGVFLPWLTVPGASDSTNGLDVPVNFLVDYATSASHDFTAGVILLVLAAAAALVALQPKMESKVPVRWVGVAIVVVAALYLGQLNRLTDASNLPYTDYLGWGPVLSAIGGVLVIFKR